MRWSRVIPPPKALSATVEHGWIALVPPTLANAAGSAPNRAWKIVPDLSPNRLVRRTHRGIHFSLVGARSRAADIDIGGRLWTAGVRPARGSLSVLTRVDAYELTDRGADPETLFGPAAGMLREALQEIDRPGRALESLFPFLARATPQRTADWRARALLSNPHGAPPSRVATLTPLVRGQPAIPPVRIRGPPGGFAQDGPPDPSPSGGAGKGACCRGAPVVRSRPGDRLLRRRPSEPGVHGSPGRGAGQWRSRGKKGALDNTR